MQTFSTLTALMSKSTEELLQADGKPLLFSSDKAAVEFYRKLDNRHDWLIISVDVIGPQLCEL